MVYGKTMSMWMAQPGMSNGHHDARRDRLSDRHRGCVRSRRRHRLGVLDRRSVEPRLRIADRSLSPAKGLGRPREPRDGSSATRGGQSDSAVYLAKRSLQLYRNAPYGYMVLAKAAAEKNQPKEAINYYKQAIDAGGKGHVGRDAGQPAQRADRRRQLRRRSVRAARPARTRRVHEGGQGSLRGARQGSGHQVRRRRA